MEHTLQEMPTPPELFRLFEEGELTREQLHAAMSLHAQVLMEEIVEARMNPVMAFYENALCRRAAARLIRRHGDGLVRQVLIALSKRKDFAMRKHLWNAAHRDVPIASYFRMKREPVFRIESIKVAPWRVHVVVEHGAAGRKECERETIELHRDRFGRLGSPAMLPGRGR